MGSVLLASLNPAACRGLEPWHWGHWGLGKSLMWRPVLCTVGYSAASWPPPTRCQEHLPTQLWRPEMSPDDARRPLGGRVALVEKHWSPSSHFLSKRFSVHWEISAAQRRAFWKQEFIYKIIFVIRHLANMFRHWNRLCLWPLKV